MIFSATITGNAEATIGAAIRSVVDWVDRVLVVDTGISDNTLAVATEAAGDKLIVTGFPWVNDFAAARNFCLSAVLSHGGEWYLMLDSDETYRGQFDASLVWECLDVDCWLIADDSGSYFRERLVRVSSLARWHGRTHEALVGIDAAHKRKLIGPAVSGTPKTPEAFQVKLQRDLAALKIETEEHPEDPRWWYYLGQTCEGLRDFERAIGAYDQCTALPGWSEQRAWACFRSAVCHAELREYAGALQCCTIGLQQDCRFPELAWYAGWNCYQLGRFDEAATWADVALSITAGGRCYDRTGFRHPFGWEEGPKNLLQWVQRHTPLARRASEWPPRAAPIPPLAGASC